jgi:uncharacterized membrane protein YqhA
MVRPMQSLQRWIESAFETFLFNARLIVILAVLGSLTSSVLMFVRGAILIVHSTKDFAHQWNNPHGEELSISLISSVDSFLFATVLLIFAMGIYELFISKIDPASRHADSRPNWLQIHSLDDLKSAVGKVILMILIVRLFESAVKMKYENPLHLLYLGLAVLFVAAALYLQHLGHKHEPEHASAEYADHGKPSSHRRFSALRADGPPAAEPRAHSPEMPPFLGNPIGHASPAPMPPGLQHHHQRPQYPQGAQAPIGPQAAPPFATPSMVPAAPPFGNAYPQQGNPPVQPQQQPWASNGPERRGW